MEDKYGYLIPSSKVILEKGDRDEIIKYIQSEHWIGYQRAVQAITKLEELISHPKCHRMPNLLIIGSTNNGKTMIAKKFCMAYPDIKGISDERFVGLKDTPVLHIQMPANPDMKRFYAEIMRVLGVPMQSTDRLLEFEIECLRYMKTCNVRMLIIDEIHNILTARKSQEQELLSSLRYIGNDRQIPIVGFGTKDAYLAIRSDSQLENRFEPFVLPLWEKGTEYSSLLASFEAIMPLREKSNLAAPKIADKILAMSEGIIGEIAVIIKKAAILAWSTAAGIRIESQLLDLIEYSSPSSRRKIFERGLT